jgi:hypothetical protein
MGNEEIELCVGRLQKGQERAARPLMMRRKATFMGR